MSGNGEEYNNFLLWSFLLSWKIPVLGKRSKIGLRLYKMIFGKISHYCSSADDHSSTDNTHRKPLLTRNLICSLEIQQ